MTGAIRIRTMRSAQHRRDASQMVFEYLAATLTEEALPTPTSIDDLPAALRAECRNPSRLYRAPGTFLLAYVGQRPIGCLGVQSQSPATGEVKRLYVHPSHRRAGVAHQLVEHAHRHAANNGFQRLVLDVMPSRTLVVEFYRRLGYTETEPMAPRAPGSMIRMQRPVIPYSCRDAERREASRWAR